MELQQASRNDHVGSPLVSDPTDSGEDGGDEYKTLPALTVPSQRHRKSSAAISDVSEGPRTRRHSTVSAVSRRMSVALRTRVSNVGEILRKPGPPDGGYSWVVLFASFMINFLGCIGSTYGVLYIEFLEYFGESNSVTAWPGSINLGLGLAAGPLASMICKRFGHRTCCILGAVLGLIGLFTSAFATNIWVLYFTFGIVCGLGDCFTYLPATVMPGYYFDKYRNFATCIAVSGLGIGILVNPILVEWFVELYTWRGALMIFAALTLNIAIFGMLLRPLPGVSDQGEEEEVNYDTSLLKQWQFLLFIVCDLLWNIGDITMYTVLPDTAYVRGIAKDKAGYLLSNLGVSTTIGRVVIAFVSSYNWNLVAMYSIGTVTSGVTMVIAAFTSNYTVFSICSVVFGLSSGVQFGLGPGITAELFGVSRLTSAYGYLVLGDGIGGFLGPPLAGWMYDMTDSYLWALVLCGILAFVAAAILAIMIIPKLRPELPEVDKKLQLEETITNHPRNSCA